MTLKNTRLFRMNLRSWLKTTKARMSLRYWLCGETYWISLIRWMALASRRIPRDVVICFREQATCMRTLHFSCDTSDSYVTTLKAGSRGWYPAQYRSLRRTWSTLMVCLISSSSILRKISSTCGTLKNVKGNEDVLFHLQTLKTLFVGFYLSSVIRGSLHIYIYILSN